MLRASANSIRVTPLVRPDSEHSPRCTLLQIDHITILLDCGADASASFASSASVIQAVLPHLDSIDAVLVSSCELASVGSLPMLAKILPARVPIIGTVPSVKLGLMNVISSWSTIFSNTTANSGEGGASDEGSSAVAAPERLTVDDIHSAFRRMQEVQFDQPVHIVHREDDKQNNQASSTSQAQTTAEQRNNNSADQTAATDVVVRALSCGRMCGASAWLLDYQTDRVLVCQDPSDLQRMSARACASAAFRAANVIIADGRVSSSSSSTGWSVVTNHTNSEEKDNLINVITKTLRTGGIALLPVNTFELGIELLTDLNKIYADKGLYSYPLILASPKAKEITERLRTLSEFLDPSTFAHLDEENDPDNMATDDGTNANDSPFPNVQLVQTAEDIAALKGTEKIGRCVIAHSSFLEEGIGAELLALVMKDDSSCIIFTEPAAPGTNAYKIQQNANHYKNSKFPFKYRKKELLVGDELEAFLAEQDRAAEEAAKKQGNSLQQQMDNGEDAQWDDEDDDEADNNENDATADKNAGKTDTSTPGLFLPRAFGTYQSQHLMFPHVLWARSTDFVSNPYGAPLDDTDLGRYRHLSSKLCYQEHSDQGIGNFSQKLTAQQIDNAPFRVETVSTAVSKVKCTTHCFDLSGRQSLESAKTFFKTNFAKARKIALVGGSEESLKSLAEFCEEQLGLTVKVPSRDMPSVDVATAVYSFDVRLHPALAGKLHRQLKSVPTGSGSRWDIGWVSGSLAFLEEQRQTLGGRPAAFLQRQQQEEGNEAEDIGAAAQEDEEEPSHKRRRTESSSTKKQSVSASDLPILRSLRQAHEPYTHVATPDGGRRQQRYRAPGTVFIGDVDLAGIQHAILESNPGCYVEPHISAPLLTADGSVAVRKSAKNGAVTLEAVPCPEMFSIRRSVYAQYGQVL